MATGYPSLQQAKQIISSVPQPRLVDKQTGELFLLIRDDVSVNGKLWIAPQSHMTQMFTVKPEAFKERFDWYVEPKDRPVPVEATTVTEINQDQTLTQEAVEKSTRRKGGRPRGSKDTKPRRRRTATRKEAST